MNWNNQEFAYALPVDLSQMRPHRQADIRTLAAMSRSEKIVEALSRSRKFVGGQALSVLEAMISPQAIGYLLAIETAYAISLAFGVGELATGLLLVAGVVFVGQEVLVLIEELVAFVEAASDARTSDDLDKAAKHMATALTLGLDIVVALLLRRRGQRAQGPEVVVRAKSGGAGGKRNSSAKGSGAGGQTPGSVGGGNRSPAPAPRPKGVPRRKRRNSTRTRKQRARTNADNMDQRRGGHSKEKHGTQVTPKQHEERIRTGRNPETGQIPVDKKTGKPQEPPKKSSGFDSDEKHLEALGKADQKLKEGLANGTLTPGKNGNIPVSVNVKDAGTSYSLNPPGDYKNGKVTTTKVHKATAVYRLNPATGKYELVTLYPK